MMDNEELEQLVKRIACDQRAPATILIIINKEGRAEVVSLILDGAVEDSCGNSRQDLAEILRKISVEVESGGGMPCGNDGTITRS